MTYQNVGGYVDMVAFSVLNVNMYWWRVCHVSDAAFLGRYLMSNTVLSNNRHADSDVCEFKVKFTRLIFVFLHVRSNKRVCLYNFLNLSIDEVIEWVNVLLYETSKSEEGWNKFPFVLKS